MKILFRDFKYSVVCSIAYCIPLFFLFKSDKYSNLYLLALGNICFAFLLILSNIFLNKKKDNLQDMLKPALKIEVVSILISSIIAVSFIFIFNKNDIVRRAPANTLGLYSMLPLSVIFGNFILGSFSIFLWAIDSKKREDNN